MLRFLHIILLAALGLTLFRSEVSAQAHAAFQVRSPNGVMRKHLQPSAILNDNHARDWMLGSWSATWRSNYFRYAPLFRARSTGISPASGEAYYNFENSMYGPAISIPLSPLKAVAFGIAYHQVIDGQSSLPLAASMANRFSFSDDQVLPSVTGQNLHLNNMQWYELSSTFAAVNHIGRKGSIRSGISIKLLGASSMMAAKLYQMDYRLQGEGLITAANYHMEMQYHIKNEGRTNVDWIITPKHPGVGIDAGISWNRSNRLPGPASGLKLVQAGISLRNLGGVWVRSDASVISGRNQEERSVDVLNTFYQLNNPADFPDSLLRAMDLSSRFDAMQMGLPTTMNMEAFLQQGDWWIYTHALLDMSFLLPFENTLSIPSRLTVTPAKYFGEFQLAFPASWTHRSGPEVGLGASVKNISLSFNSIFSLVRLNKFRRFGIHIAISSPIEIKRKRRSRFINE